MKLNINSPNVVVRKDKDGRIRKINFRLEPFRPEGKISNTLDLAVAYIKEATTLFEISGQTENLRKEPEINLKEDKLELRYYKDYSSEHLSKLSFIQTYFGIPLWHSNFQLRMQPTDLTVISSESFVTYDNIEMQTPKEEDLKKYADIDSNQLAKLLGFGDAKDFEVQKSDLLYIYKYIGENILGEPLKETTLKPMREIAEKLERVSLSENRHYLVREVLFSYIVKGVGLINWRCFIEIENGAILYLFPFTSSITGLLFKDDPTTEGHTVNINDSDATLNAVRTAVTLERLENPVGGVQKLRGASSGGFAKIINMIDDPTDPLHSLPNDNPPTRPALANFNYSARTGDFAAVNAYYNVDRFIALIEDLGIHLNQQFPTTQLPLSVDHRALNDVINAQAPGGPGGLFALGVRLGSISSSSPYLGMATSYRVTLHEFGHVLLYDHGNGPNFGFAHSYGDSLAAILNDPSTQAPDRFSTFPWVNSAGPVVARRHDRAVSAGWAWDGTLDYGGYSSEEILSTTLFRIYRSLGGDGPYLSRRLEASRTLVLLMLKAVQKLSPPHTAHAEDLADLLMEADTLNGVTDPEPHTIDGFDLGASHKVIRWGFEKQGAYQTPPFGNQVGQPPAVDVYIDDGRNGEYQYLYNFWETTDIVNRQNPDGIFTHQVPILSTTNYLYVKIKNRGTTAAENIVLKGYQCSPGGGMVWPVDWNLMLTPQVNVPGTLAPGMSMIVGPIQWVPTQPGHECLLVSVSATGDIANTETVSPAQCHYLVTNDNNLSQRNVAPAPAFSGGLHLAEAFSIYQFTVRNPFLKAVEVVLRVKLPTLLADRGWSVEFPETGSKFPLEEFDRKGVLVRMRLIEGEPFTREDVLATEDRDIVIFMESEEGLLGGMNYRLDPDLDVYNETQKG